MFQSSVPFIYGNTTKMSRVSKYLQRRGDVYQLRLPIPNDLKAIVGRSELRRSLRTKDKTEAENLTWRGALAFRDLCNKLRTMPSLPTEEIKQLIQSFFNELVSQPEYKVGDNSWPGNMHILQLDPGDVVTQLSSGKFGDGLMEKADYCISKHGHQFNDLSEEQQILLTRGMARAELELQRYRHAKAIDPMVEYLPSDDWFKTEANALQLQSIANPKQKGADSLQGGEGGSLSEIVEEFLGAGENKGIDKRKWSAATAGLYRRVMPWFVELVGGTTDVRKIKTSHVKQMRSILENRKKGTASGVSIHDIADAPKGEVINPKTAAKEFDCVKTFLSWCEREEYIEHRPGSKIKIIVPRKPKSEERRSFTSTEINQYFSSPQFAGYKSKHRRSQPGNITLKDDDYWLPLLLAYTGMRLSEPLYLAAEDVVIDSPVPYFKLRWTGARSLKTVGSERDVPIHPDLEAYGFYKFVRERQKQVEQGGLLFSGFPTDKHLGNYCSQRLGRYLRNVGITDKRVATHSFRHSMKDALRNAKCPEEERDQILGHENSSVKVKYGDGAKLSVLHDWLCKIDLGLTHETKEILKR